MVRDVRWTVIGQWSDPLAPAPSLWPDATALTQGSGDQVLADRLAGGLRPVTDAELVLRLFKMRSNSFFAEAEQLGYFFRLFSHRNEPEYGQFPRCDARDFAHPARIVIDQLL